MNNKDTGSFYTPVDLIQYMVSYIRTRIKPSSVLEPSAGDGRFVDELRCFHSLITLVENEASKSDFLHKRFGDTCQVYGTDFITFSLNRSEAYDLVIGNPPYIPKKKVEETQVDASKKLAELFDLDPGIFQNLWVSFVLASIKLLSSNGAIFFVLPFEFLQVQYAEKLREFLEKKFNTIEIITFEDQIFEDIEQDICLVYMTNEPEGKPYIQYTTLNNSVDRKTIFQSRIMRNKPLKKWSNCILGDDETEALKRVASQFPRADHFGDISPGIVTGANSFFILSKEEIDALHVPSDNSIPIILKSSSIPPLLRFKKEDFEGIEHAKVKSYLLSTSKLDSRNFSVELAKYLEDGEKLQINERYKCKNRPRWYDVPIVKNGSACFFKRFHFFPRIIINSANVYTTDISYNIRFYTNYDANSFAFSFYNSLTLALCEYNGRFYGGGVGELVPSEFKALRIPYQTIPDDAIQQLDQMIRCKASIDEIVSFVDGYVLLDLTDEELATLQSIRQRYVNRRMKLTRRSKYE